MLSISRRSVARRRRLDENRAWRALKHTLRKSKLTVISAILVLFIVVTALFAPQIATHDPIAGNYRVMLQPPSGDHLFGTDELGRDIFSRVVYGARISIMIGLLALAVGLVVGVTIGLMTGYFGVRPNVLAQLWVRMDLWEAHLRRLRRL